MLKTLKNKLRKLIMWCKGYRKYTPDLKKDTKK